MKKYFQLQCRDGFYYSCMIADVWILHLVDKKMLCQKTSEICNKATFRPPRSWHARPIFQNGFLLNQLKMNHKNIMCVLCFNSQWRSVVIGSVSTGLSLLILLTSLAYHSQVSLHLATKVQEQKCYQSEDVYVKRTSTTGSGGGGNECVFLAFSTLYPWPLWIILGLYILLSINLVVSAVYK